jgi:integrase/recombinase XerD
VFSDEEVEFILARCVDAEPPSITPGFFSAAIILGRDLGLRLGDICRLEWSQFNLLKKTIVVWQGKTNSRIELPLNSRVLRLLAHWIVKRHQKYLFPIEKEIADDQNRRAALSVVMTRFFGSCGFVGFSFHSLRATLATTLANQGKSIEEIAEALGHKSPGVTPDYIRKNNAAKVNLR